MDPSDATTPPPEPSLSRKILEEEMGLETIKEVCRLRDEAKMSSTVVTDRNITLLVNENAQHGLLADDERLSLKVEAVVHRTKLPAGQMLWVQDLFSDDDDDDNDGSAGIGDVPVLDLVVEYVSFSDPASVKALSTTSRKHRPLSELQVRHAKMILSGLSKRIFIIEGLNLASFATHSPEKVLLQQIAELIQVDPALEIRYTAHRQESYQVLKRLHEDLSCSRNNYCEPTMTFAQIQANINSILMSGVWRVELYLLRCCKEEEHQFDSEKVWNTVAPLLAEPDIQEMMTCDELKKSAAELIAAPLKEQFRMDSDAAKYVSRRLLSSYRKGSLKIRNEDGTALGSSSMSNKAPQGKENQNPFEKFAYSAASDKPIQPDPHSRVLSTMSPNIKSKDPPEALPTKYPPPRNGWKPEEDAIIYQAMNDDEYFCDWVSLSKELPGRKPYTIQGRWMNYLHPSLTHAPVSHKEDLLLWRSHKVLGSQWAEIADVFFQSTRSAAFLQRRWKSKAFRETISKTFGSEAYHIEYWLSDTTPISPIPTPRAKPKRRSRRYFGDSDEDEAYIP